MNPLSERGAREALAMRDLLALAMHHCASSLHSRVTYYLHQYNFQCQKLVMQIRSALIVCVFGKGLRLWSASWRNHVRRGPDRELHVGRCAANLQRDRAAGGYPVGGAAVDERHSGHPMRHGEPREAGRAKGALGTCRC